MRCLPCMCRYAAIERLRPFFEAVQAYWLSPGELCAFARFRDRTRRETWLAGRLLAKRLIASLLDDRRGLPRPPQRIGIVPMHNSFTSGPAFRYSDIEISSAGARPQVWLNGRLLKWSLSIAHTSRGVLIGLSRVPGISLGVDLVEPGIYGPGFADAWFTPAERRWLARSGPAWQAVLWAIKEAVYKAANDGEPFDPRSIETVPIQNNAYACTFRRDEVTLSCHVAVWQTPKLEFAVFAWGLAQYLFANRLALCPRRHNTIYRNRLLCCKGDNKSGEYRNSAGTKAGLFSFNSHQLPRRGS